jgi:hypothetical protein
VSFIFGISAAAVLVALLPFAIAFGRRHHQRYAIAALASVPVLGLAFVIFGLLTAVASTGQPGGVGMGFAFMGMAGGWALLSVGGLCWFIAVIWGLTAVQYQAPAHKPDKAALEAVSQAAIERRRDERRSRGY